MTRYLSGLCVAGLGLCGGGWLIVAAVALGGESAGQAGRVNLLTGAGLVVVSSASLGCWAAAWRRRMRVDGLLADRFSLVPRHEARRNKREPSRDVGRTARLAKRSARDARRAARRSARLAGGNGGVLSSGAGLGSAPGGDGAYSVAVSPVRMPVPPVPPGDREAGESAVELLSELRAMLAPLLTAAAERPAAGSQPGPAPDGPGVPDAPAEPAVPPPVVAPLPKRTPPPAPPADGDDLRFIADGEEAWW
jgi:hypothetical protein